MGLFDWLSAARRERADLSTVLAARGARAKGRALSRLPCAALFDAECVDDVRDYAEVLRALDELTGGALQIAAVTYEEGSPRKITVPVAGADIVGELRGSTDWIDLAVLDLCNRVAHARGSERELRAYDSGGDGQEVLVVWLHPDDFERLDEAGLRREWPELTALEEMALERR